MEHFDREDARAAGRPCSRACRGTLGHVNRRDRRDGDRPSRPRVFHGRCRPGRANSFQRLNAATNQIAVSSRVHAERFAKPRQPDDGNRHASSARTSLSPLTAGHRARRSSGHSLVESGKHPGDGARRGPRPLVCDHQYEPGPGDGSVGSVRDRRRSHKLDVPPGRRAGAGAGCGNLSGVAVNSVTSRVCFGVSSSAPWV